MIIKIIPETAEEKRTAKEIKHVGVKDFFFCGNKKDKEEALVDFHDWHGSYRFLEGSLLYFSNIIREERQEKERWAKGGEIGLTPQGQTKPQFIKTGETAEIKVIDTKQIQENMGGKVTEFPLSLVQNAQDAQDIKEAEELPVEEEAKEPEEQAEDDK